MSPAHLATSDALLAAADVVTKQEEFDDARYEMSGAVLEILTNKASLSARTGGTGGVPAVNLVH